MWLIIVAGIAITFFERYAMLELTHRVRLPLWFLRSLRFVPPALLTAIAIPGIVYTNGALDLSPLQNDKLLACAVSALVAWRTRNVLLSMAGGMIVAWLLALRG